MDVRSSKKTWLKDSPSDSQQNQACKSIDSGVGSFEEGDSTEPHDSAMTAAENLTEQLLQNGERPLSNERFPFVYLGFAVLDRRYTQSMLPWVIAEVRRRKERNDIHLCVEGSSVKAVNVADGTTISFQHGVQSITRCARSLDKKCFAYLVKSNESTCSCFCYVFESVDNLSVRLLPVIILFKSCCCFFLSILIMLTIYFCLSCTRDT